MGTCDTGRGRGLSLAVLALVVAVFAFLVPVRSESAMLDCFLKIDQIQGESTNAKHVGEIDVLTWGFGDSNSSARSMSGAAATGRVQMQDLRFSTRLGKQSPKLFEAVATGKAAKEAILTCHTPGGAFPVVFVVRIQDVFVTGYQTGTPIPTGTQTQTSVDPYPVDQVTLNFAKIKVEYIIQKRPDGTGGGKVEAGWDIPANKAYY